MTFFFGGLALAVFGMFGAAMLMKRRQPRDLAMTPDLAPRIEAARVAFAAAAPWIPATAADAPEAAAAIEAALIAGDAEKALAAAEAAVAALPTSAASRVWLAWALCASAEPVAALVQLERAEKLEPSGAKPRSLAKYIEARARHLAFELESGALVGRGAAGMINAIPPLVTAGDVALVTLAGTRGGAAWMTGENETDLQISGEELAGAVSEHRTTTSHALGLALDALAAEPGFADAAYLAARLAIKSGSIAAGTALFEAVASRMPGRPDAEAFARDLRDLADPKGAVAAAMTPPPPVTPPQAKRSRSLKVLK